MYNLTRYGVAKYGFKFLAKLTVSAIYGWIDGLKAHYPVPKRTIAFYRNPGLCPTYGNVPLKIGKRVFNKILKLLHRNE